MPFINSAIRDTLKNFYNVSMKWKILERRISEAEKNKIQISGP